MEILLVRHGHAVEDAPGLGDAGRWLSARGRKTTRRVARWLADSKKWRPVVIWTSPLVRAAQTAEILAARVKYKGEIRALAELSPGRDPGDLLKLLAEASSPRAAEGGPEAAPVPEPIRGPLALVGHEPSLSMIAGALVGDLDFGGFRKSGILAVSWADGQGRARFLLDPAEMKVLKGADIGRAANAAAPVSPK